MKITALLGAGAFVDIDGCSTEELTNNIKSLRKIYPQKFPLQDIDEPFLLKVANELDDFWEQKRNDNKLKDSDKCNFEDILDALEKLYSFKRFGDDPKYFKPTLGAFICSLKNYYFMFGQKYINFLIRESINIIANSVKKYDDKFEPTKKDHWFSSFWKKAVNVCNWNIATLNYDTCIEKSIELFEDGFEKSNENLSKFSFVQLKESKTSNILHLHGCILYGYPPKNTDSNAFFTTDYEELYKYNSFDEAKKSWNKRPLLTKQSHEATMVGPIITGLGKTDKLIACPYIDYNNAFYESVLQNDRILIAGYSFGDFHLNKILERMAYKPENKKIVVITYQKENDFSWNNNKPLKNIPKMEEFIIKNANDWHPFKKPFDYPAESTNGNVRLYYKGFRSAIEEYGNEIIDFLSS